VRSIATPGSDGQAVSMSAGGRTVIVVFHVDPPSVEL
jgi:hypothetical protein